MITPLLLRQARGKLSALRLLVPLRQLALFRKPGQLGQFKSSCRGSNPWPTELVRAEGVKFNLQGVCANVKRRTTLQPRVAA
jgi:hypothetical protein